MTHSPQPRRHLPVLDEDNRRFWQGGREAMLVLTRCQSCGLYIHPHAAICRRCQSRDLRPEAVSGLGSVATFTINRHPWEAGLDAPYTIAIVTLDEQPRLNLTSNIVNCPVEAVAIGMRVRVVFEPVEDIWLPLFEPV